MSIVEKYNIEKSNATFEQKIPVVILRDVSAKKNECFRKNIFINNLTGESAEIERRLCKERHRGIKARNYTYDTRYDIQYDRVANCIVVMLLRLEISHREKGNFFRKISNLQYKEINRYYITPNKEVIYDANADKKGKDIQEDWVIHPITKIGDFPFSLAECEWIDDTGDDLSLEEMSNHTLNVVGNIFNKIITVSGNKNLLLESMSDLIEFLVYKEPKVRQGPLQRKIDEYCTVEVPEFIPHDNTNDESSICIEGRLCKIKDDLTCLQMFSVYNKEVFYETFRIFISKDEEIISCKKNNLGEFVPTRLSLGGSHWVFSIYDYDSKSIEGTKLSYYKDIINDIPIECRGYAVWCFLINSKFELLYKAGLKNTLNNLFELAPEYPVFGMKLFMKIDFSDDTKIKNINKLIGLNSYQISKIEEYMAPSKNNYNLIQNKYLVNNMKEALTSENPDGQRNDISFFDNNTFDKIFEVFKKANDIHFSDSIKKVFGEMVKVYGFKVAMDNIDTVEFIGLLEYREIDLYLDYLSMVQQMEKKSLFRPKVTTNEELMMKHNDIMYLYKFKKSEIKIKAFKEAIIGLDKYEFADDKYSIVIPTCPDDLVKEGNELHHCVKTYIDRVINKKTNIVFVRKNDNLDKPFYTIEITNDNTIRQIHGNFNCKLSEDKDAEKFVKKWIKDKNLLATYYDKAL